MSQPDAIAADAAGRAYVAGQILVQFESGLDAPGIQRLLGLAGLDLGEIVRGPLEGVGALTKAVLPPGLSIEKAIEIISHLPGVKFAEPNWVYSIQATSNDPGYTGGQLWGMYGDQTSPSNSFGSQAGEAWAAGFTGSTKVGVGIVDSGVDYTHADLYLNIWLNPGEIPADIKAALVDADGDGVFSFRDLNAGANAAHVTDKNNNGRIDAGDLLQDTRWENGVDNDGNGYKDDLIGWDFVNNDNDPYDDHSHGTHVAGTIGAMGGNGAGVAGVNWAIQMVPLKFLAANGNGSLDHALKALDYLTNVSKAGGPVDFAATNNSWGGGGYSQALLDAIVRGAKQEILFVAAAGNGGWDGRGDNNDSTANYPSNYSTLSGAGYEAVIAVASITSSGGLSSFSNYGVNTVDLGAPGSSVYSTVPGGYATKSGTSMAAPHVTGALALFTALQGAGFSAAAIRTALLDATVDIPSLANRTVTGGRLDIGLLMGGGGGGPPDPTPTQTVTIGSATDDVGPKTGALVSGAATNDAAPTLNGSLSAQLQAGQSLVVFRDGVQVGQISPAGTSWSFTDTGASEGAHAWTARVVGAGDGPLSGAFNLTIDTTAPAQTAQITAAGDNVGAATGDVASGGSTDDASPLLKGTLSVGLGTGEVLAVWRDGVRIGQASVSGTDWSYQDGGVASGAHSWQVRVEDAAGNLGAASSSFGLTITAPAGPNVIWGTTGSDNLVGTAGADRIYGVPQAGTDVARGDIDVMTGGLGPDTFVLGEVGRGRFYDDGSSWNAGTGDYARIMDFTPGEDVIQLYGPASRYLFAPVTIGGVTGIGVYYDTNGNGSKGSWDELIGVVKGVSSLDAASLVYV